MVAYFARRLVGGAVTLFLGSLLIYSMVLYTPGSIYSNLQEIAESKSHEVAHASPYIERLIFNFSVDKPWPLNYAGWLLNPNKTTQTIFDKNDDPRTIHTGIDLNVGNLRLLGSGIRTGDLGFSMELAPYHLITDMFGPGFGEFMLLLPMTLFATMAFVLMQRWRRPQIDDLTRGPHVRVLVDEYRQHLVFSRL